MLPAFSTFCRMAQTISSVLADLVRLVVPVTLAEESQELLRESGKHEFEALVLWAGRARTGEAGVFDVELVLMPRQYAMRTDDGVAVMVEGDALFDMNVALNERGLRLLAQLHSHPGDAYHSETDDRYSVVTARGGLSLVVPDFARGGFSLERCAVYQLREGGEWIELSHRQAASLIHIDSEL